MSGSFSGNTIAITGAAGGIGQWLCRFFGAEGATIAALDRSAKVNDLVDTLGKDGLLRYLGGEQDTTWWNFSLDVLKRMVVDAGFERIELLNTFHFGGPYNHAIIHAFPKR